MLDVEAMVWTTLSRRPRIDVQLVSVSENDF